VIDLEMEDISESVSREMSAPPIEQQYHTLPNSSKRPSQLVRQYHLKTKYRKTIQKERPTKLNNCWLYAVRREESEAAGKPTRPEEFVVSSSLLDREVIGVANVEITVDGKIYLFAAQK